VLSVDCSFKSKSTSDFVAIHKYGVLGVRSYLIERRTERMGYIQTKAAIKEMQSRGRPASVILIESAANGIAVIEELQADPDFGAAVIAVEPQGDKITRANAASADVEASSIYLPENAEWLTTFLRTFAAFPGTKNDDDVDAASQFINWRRTRNMAYGVLDYFRRTVRDIRDGVRDAFGQLLHKPEPKPQPAPNAAQPSGLVTRDQWREWCDSHRAPACPKCQSPCTVWHADGHGGLVLHCNQCSANSINARWSQNQHKL
jgi:predicted phage terminase large subunit-like protein